jgi:hypothetical protein
MSWALLSPLRPPRRAHIPGCSATHIKRGVVTGDIGDPPGATWADPGQAKFWRPPDPAIPVPLWVQVRRKSPGRPRLAPRFVAGPSCLVIRVLPVA